MRDIHFSEEDLRRHRIEPFPLPGIWDGAKAVWWGSWEFRDSQIRIEDARWIWVLKKSPHCWYFERWQLFDEDDVEDGDEELIRYDRERCRLWGAEDLPIEEVVAAGEFVASSGRLDPEWEDVFDLELPKAPGADRPKWVLDPFTGEACWPGPLHPAWEEVAQRKGIRRVKMAR